jgi:hypothetical protein
MARREDQANEPHLPSTVDRAGGFDMVVRRVSINTLILKKRLSNF